MLVKPQYQYTTKEARRAIIDQSFRILEEIGVDVFSAKALALYREANCKVEGNRVRMPRPIVEAALASAPSTIQIYDRNGEEAMLLGASRSYFGPGPTCVNYMDARTGERRPARKEDAATTAFVADALPNMDYVMSLVMVGDKTKELADVHEIDAMLRNTTKPLCGWAFTPKNCQSIIDLCSAAIGDLSTLQEKPFLLVYCEPTTPLLNTEEAIEILIKLAENNIPCVYSTGMILGATAPVTIPAALSIGLSEVLSGLVLSQHVRPGTPFVGAANGGAMDMSTMQHAYGSPQLQINASCSAEILHELGIPHYGTAGPTDSKVVDGQACSEVTSQIINAMGSGQDLVHDVGFMELGMLGSPLLMVVSDEIIDYARRLMRGIEIDENQLAFDVIQGVGPRGNFLESDHTLENFKDELWVPTLFDHSAYTTWETQGAKDLAEKAQDKLNNILDTHQPQSLPDDVLRQMDRIVVQAEDDFRRLMDSQ